MNECYVLVNIHWDLGELGSLEERKMLFSLSKRTA